jgi:DNA repair protein RadC
MTLLSLPEEARPRERLAQLGPSALSSIELIAILLGSGTKNRSVLELAADLLAHFGTLEALADATLPELSALKGIGPAKAVQIQASFALSKRLRAQPLRPMIDSPQRAYLELLPHLIEEKTEVLYVLLRDVRRNLLHKEEIGRGTLNHVIVHPREVFSVAIRHRAHSLIVAHNHPSGDPTPSHADREITHKLAAASSIIGIPLIDHLILGRDRFFSFQEKGLLEGSSWL